MILLTGVWFIDANRSQNPTMIASSVPYLFSFYTYEFPSGVTTLVILTLIIFPITWLINLHNPWVYSLLMILWMYLYASSSWVCLGIPVRSDKNDWRISLAFVLNLRYPARAILHSSSASSVIDERGQENFSTSPFIWCGTGYLSLSLWLCHQFP